MRAERTGEGRQLGGIAAPVVDAADQRPLDGETPAARRDVGRARLGELGQRIATVDGHQLVAQAVVRRVQRDGQVDRQCFARQPADAGHHSHRRERQVAGREADVAVEPHHRAPHPVVVGQGFPHPHEHDVGDAPRPGHPHGGHHLFHDLALAQVALEACLARRTELARHGTPRLGRNADGHAVRVAHQHRLDLGAVVQAPQPLRRLPAVRLPARHLVEGRRQCLGQLAAQRHGQLGHLLGPLQPDMERVPELAGPVGGCIPKEPGQLVSGQVVRRGHGRQVRGGSGAQGVQLRRTAPSCWPNDTG